MDSNTVWEVRQDPRDPNAWDVYDGVRKVAHLPWQRQADAKVIAAAPKMLQALKQIKAIAERIATEAAAEGHDWEAQDADIIARFAESALREVA